jgi:DNA-binding CsgD family transcriptional regulator/PAS domain-containing protein
MPSIRIPPALRRVLPGRDSDAGRAEGASGAPRPPITVRSPRLQAFLRVAFEVLYDWDIDSGVVSMSEQIDKALGLPAGGFPRTIEGWLGRIHPNDRERTMAALAHSIENDELFQAEYRLEHADGRWLAFGDQGVVLTGRGGKPASMIGAMRDVTHELRAGDMAREVEELRSVLFRLPSPAMQVDAHGAYLDADRQALSFFRRSREEMLAATVHDDFPATVTALVTGDCPDADDTVELEVECDVCGEKKSLLLSVIPCHIEGQRGHFLLGTEITQQKAMQDELARSERALRRQATILDERNTALRVLLEQREQDNRELEQRIVNNVEQLLEPTIERLSKTLRHRPERLELEAMRLNLREIVGPFGQRLRYPEDSAQPLTRREREVANLVRLGKTSAEIAEALHVSRSAVSFHRASIRRKLGLPKGGPRLSTHLSTLAER